MMTRMGQNISRVRARIDLHGTPIVLKWNTAVGGTTDPTTRNTIGGTVTANTSTIKGFVHFINPAITGYRAFTELQTGDAILDLDPEVNLEGKPDLIFEFCGQQWMQKNVGDQVAKALDAVYGGSSVSRVVVVTLRA